MSDVLRVARPTTRICATPQGARERELLLGDTFVVETRDMGWVRGRARKDQYAGWVEEAALVPEAKHMPTHKVIVPRSYLKPAPGLKDTSPPVWVSFGAQVAVLDDQEGWAKVGFETDQGCLYAPSTHLAPLDSRFADPVAVAEMFLNTPYLWGGNSGYGLDCSGLVQAACTACGLACLGDSGPQERDFSARGMALPPDTAPRRGDLLYWKGHVAWVSDADTLLHANAHHMAVAYEPLKEAIARIKAQGDGPVTSHIRPLSSF